VNQGNISLWRLYSQQFKNTKCTQPVDVVEWLGVLQAQDYSGAKWSIGLRLLDHGDAQVERSILNHDILRSWLLRGTLHFVAAVDIRWILGLVSARIIAGTRRRTNELGLDEHTFTRSNDILAKALSAGSELNRPALFAILEQNGISCAGQRGVYMLQRASLEGLICQGITRNNQPTFFLVDAIATQTGRMERQEALRELARRYFYSRGPATQQDFAWWSGLSSADVRTAINAVEGKFTRDVIDDQIFFFPADLLEIKDEKGNVYLMPGFDEYLLSYQNRSASLDVPRYKRVTPTNGMLPATMVLDGKVIGTWKRIIKTNKVMVELMPFEPLSKVENQLFAKATDRFGQFLGMQAEVHHPAQEQGSTSEEVK